MKKLITGLAVALLSLNLAAQSNCYAEFQYTLGLCPNVLFVSDLTDPGSPDANYLWDFGDGTVSDEPSPEHYYGVDGIYQVCLTVEFNGCTSTQCQEVIVDCNVQPPVCESYFQYTTGDCPTVHFFGATTTPPPGIAEEWLWDFGDGSFGVGPNPIHTYASNGIYGVCLTTVDVTGCTANYCDEIIIDCIPPTCEAYFQYTLGDCPTIHFYGSNSTGGNDGEYIWHFGDGTVSDEANPVHTYSVNGWYNVCLITISPDGCTAEYCEEIFIGCVPPECEAFFEYTAGDCPVVHFFGYTNTISDPVSWFWEFGDGHTSTEQNPIHTYVQNGQYVPCLVITTANGCSATFCQDIFIDCNQPCEAWFQYTLSDCPSVQFFASNTNPAPGTNAWHWDFGDGTTGTGPNPVHTYAENGIYVVCLIVECEDGTASDYCEEIFIQCVPPPCEAYFEYNQEACGAFEFWAANANIPPTDPIIWTWHFGDGTTATGPYVNHTFSANGIYTVCLLLTTPEGCTDEYCEDIIVDCLPHPCNAFFDYQIDCPVAQFYVILPPDVAPGTEYLWDFGDGHSGQGWEPAHTYEYNGIYEVCLTVICEDGSIEEFCNTIIIDCVPPPCLALFAHENNCPEVEFFVALPSNGAPNSEFLWDFGDGHYGVGFNPVHVYEANGIYLACLTVVCEDGSVEDYCEEVIIECFPSDCQAHFQYSQEDCPTVEFFAASATTPVNDQNYYWDFGDGHTGTGPNPEHTYCSNGTYTVCLIVITDDGCVAQHCKQIVVDCIPQACNANFDYSQSDCPIIHFYTSDVPNSTTQWQWIFGDGSTGYGPNPEHEYANNGTYTVCLVVTMADGCTAAHCEEIVVDCSPPTCEVYFGYDIEGCDLVHFFVALPAGDPNSFEEFIWDFGDGTIDYGLNPIHAFPANGVYTVCLTMITGDGCVAEYCEEIIIECQPSCQPGFQYDYSDCPTIQFYGYGSTDPIPGPNDIWQWDFGDGHYGYGPNPEHTYAENGIYIVCLTTVCENGTAVTYCEEVWIDCIPQNCEAYFQYTLWDCPTVHFFSLTSFPPVGSNDNWQWDFGDGSIGYGPEAIHTYQQGGVYTVCLTITTADGCTAIHCEEIWIDCDPQCETFFEFNREDCPTIEFYSDVSSPSGNDYMHWDFGDGSTGDGPNPIHTYTDNGMFEVCLTVVTQWGCTATYCDVVRINCLRTGLVYDWLSTVAAYPNPTTDLVAIEFEESYDEIHYSLSGMDGNEYERRTITAESSFEVDLKGLINGIYFLKIEAGENSGTIKLFKY